MYIFLKMVLCVCILHVYDSSRSLLPILCACISVYYSSVSLLFFVRFICSLFAYMYSPGAAPSYDSPLCSPPFFLYTVAS